MAAESRSSQELIGSTSQRTFDKVFIHHLFTVQWLLRYLFLHSLSFLSNHLDFFLKKKKTRCFGFSFGNRNGHVCKLFAFLTWLLATEFPRIKQNWSDVKVHCHINPQSAHDSTLQWFTDATSAVHLKLMSLSHFAFVATAVSPGCSSRWLSKCWFWATRPALEAAVWGAQRSICYLRLPMNFPNGSGWNLDGAEAYMKNERFRDDTGFLHLTVIQIREFQRRSDTGRKADKASLVLGFHSASIQTAARLPV